VPGILPGTFSDTRRSKTARQDAGRGTLEACAPLSRPENEGSTHAMSFRSSR
jgi:hypothetical protein